MHHAHARRRWTPAVLVAVVVGLAVLAVVVVSLVASRLVAPQSGAPEPPSVAPVVQRSLVASRPEVRAAHLLGRWHAARAAAWAAGDETALAALYVPGSTAGRRDLAMLQRWAARGLRVEGLRTQIVRVQVLSRRPGRWELEVVDRLAGGVAVGVGTRRDLPGDTPGTRRVVLVGQPESGHWQVATSVSTGSGSISADPRAARP